MQNIPKSYRYLLALVLILLAFPFVSGFIMSSRIKNNQYTMVLNNEQPPKIPIPAHNTFMIDSYNQGLSFYVWWSNDADTIISYDLTSIMHNQYYYQQKLSGDTFSIYYQPYLKTFINSQHNPKETAKKKIEPLSTTLSLVGKAPETMIINGGDIQVSPIENTKHLNYIVEQGSLSLGIIREDRGHFYNLSKQYPNIAIGYNHQPDWESEIISPSTIHLSKQASLFIKDGYNTAQTEVIASPNSFINIDHPNAHIQIKWQLSDSTYIHCNKLQEAWFQENFPNTKLIFTPNEKAPLTHIAATHSQVEQYQGFQFFLVAVCVLQI